VNKTDKAIELKRDAALARALSTPHKPHKPLKAKVKKKAKKAGAVKPRAP
jgi:hypothetical protein